MSRTSKSFSPHLRTPKFRSSARQSISAKERLEEFGLTPPNRLKAACNFSGGENPGNYIDRVISCYREGRTALDKMFLGGEVIYERESGTPYLTVNVSTGSMRVIRLDFPKNPLPEDLISKESGDTLLIEDVLGKFTLKVRNV